MSGKRIEAGDAYVGLGIRSKIKEGLATARKRLEKFGSFARNTGAGISAGGLALSGGFVAAAKVFASTGDRLDKLSGRTGVAVEELAKLGFAAERSGGSLEDVEKGLKSQARFLQDFSEGGSTSVKTMEALGLAASDLEKKTPDERLKVFADALSNIEDPGTKAALSMRVFGRAGSNLLPLLSTGAKGINALGSEAKKLGLTLSQDQTTAAAEFTDAWGDVSSVFKGAVTQIGAAVAGPLTSLLKLVAAGSSQVVMFIKANQGLVAAVGGVAAVMVAAGGALAAAGTAAIIIPPALGAIAAAGGVVAGVFGALVSPIALVGATLVAGVSYFAAYTEAGREVVSFFTSGFNTLSGIVTTVIGGIGDALSGGDLMLAAKIGFTGVKLVIGEALQSIESVFNGTFQGLFTTVGDLAKSIGKVFVAINKLRQQASNTIASVLASGAENVEAAFGGSSLQGLSDNLKADQARAAGKASDFENLVNGFNPKEFGESLSDAFDVGALRAELDTLKSDASDVADEVQEAKKEAQKEEQRAQLPTEAEGPINKIQDTFKAIASLSAASLGQRRPDARPIEDKMLKEQEDQTRILREVRDGLKTDEAGLTFS